MPFVAEDGTGLSNANSLCTLAFADAYFTDRARVAWIGADSVKQAALIDATDYVESRWGGKFLGEAQFEDQALSFPRLGIDSDGAVPDGIMRAVAEYAIRALGGKPLTPDPVTHASGLALAGEKRKVGPIETEVRFQPGSAKPIYKSYPAADALVRPFLMSVGGLVRC